VGEQEADVLVLGAGLAGLGAAIELARPRRRVAVLEAASVATGPSGADLGHIATGLDLPYTRAVGRYGREAARTLWEWHRESHERLRALLGRLGEGCGYRQRGGFVLARDRAQAVELADSEDALREDGFPGEFLDHYMLEARFDVRGFAAGYWAADDAEVEPVALQRALAAHAREQGTALFEASPILELIVEKGGLVARTARGVLRAPAGVAALGASAPALLPALAPSLLPLRAHRLAFGLPSGGPALPSPARTVDGRLAWRQGRDFRAAWFSGPAEGGDSEACFRELSGVLQGHLHLGGEPLGRWAGELVATPDSLPLVGFLPGSPLAVVAGLGARGAYSWAFVAARWTAASLRSGRDEAPAGLRPARLAGLSPTADPG
jgi:glycine/D-amino acid oxidase-like deaminating enzyme